MRTSARILLTSLALTLMLSLVFMGCSDDSSSTGTGTPPADFSGIWDTTLTVIAKTTCDNEIGESLSQDGFVAQDGNQALLIIGGVASVELTINGSNATGTWTGPLSTMEFNLTIENGILGGTVTETQADCTEIYSVTGTRTNAPPSSEFEGYWDFELEVTSSQCEGDLVGSIEDVCLMIEVNSNTVLIDDGASVLAGVGDGNTAILMNLDETEQLVVSLTVSGDTITGEVSTYSEEDECLVVQLATGTRRGTPCPQPSEGSDFSGFWFIDGEFVTNECEFSIVPGCVEFVQDGNDVTIDTEGLHGTVNGNTLTFRQVLPLGNAIASSEIIFELSTNGNNLTGTNTITVVDSENSENNCTSMANMTGVRLSGCDQLTPSESILGVLQNRLLPCRRRGSSAGIHPVLHIGHDHGSCSSCDDPNLLPLQLLVTEFGVIQTSDAARDSGHETHPGTSMRQSQLLRWLMVPLGALISALALPTDSQAALRYMTDDLEAHLVFDITIAREEDSFVPPSAAEQAIFYAAVQGLLRGAITATANAIDPLGYDLIDFTDTVSSRTYYVLEERQFARGLGTYVVNPNPERLLNIQAPHPRVDGGTWEESVVIFLQTEALFFQIAGTHRCAHPTPTTCSGTTGLCDGIYRISDVAHYTENFFQTASNAVHDELEYLVSISIHGYGCDTQEEYEASSLAQISNGTSIDVAGSIATRLALEYNAILFSSAINYPFTGAGSFNRHSSESSLLDPVACNLMSGGTNVQGRYINGETDDPCGTGVTSPVLRERFLHIEQQPALRGETPDGNGISWQITIDAISNLFEPTMWVDFAHTGIQSGSWGQPYSSLAAAVSHASAGETVMLKSGQGLESILLTDPPLLLRSAGGSTLIRGATAIAVR